MGCVDQRRALGWATAACSLITVLPASISRCGAAISSCRTTGGSRENFQSRQVSRAEVPWPFFRVILFVIWLRKRHTEKLKMVSRRQPSAGTDGPQRSICYSVAEVKPQLQCEHRRALL